MRRVWKVGGTLVLVAVVVTTVACGELTERDGCGRWERVQELVTPYRDLATSTATVSELREAGDRLNAELHHLDDATEHQYARQIAQLTTAVADVRNSVVDVDGDQPVAGQAALAEDTWQAAATAYSELESAIGPTCADRSGNDR